MKMNKGYHQGSEAQNDINPYCVAFFVSEIRDKDLEVWVEEKETEPEI